MPKKLTEEERIERCKQVAFLRWNECSRKQICEGLGISIPTLTKIVTEAKERGLLLEGDPLLKRASA